MSNVLEVQVDPDIELDEDQTVGMPEEARNRLLITMTIFCQQNDCHWSELVWSVKKNGVISVKRGK
jgi:hypothetical protein